ncbi:unnamed protein product [Somion occarium]|uniref:SET domain-containing protein n=2 Tax=Somion occarium TaxID=3059160 RepID=A0ABP1DAA1_9APHY
MKVGEEYMLVECRDAPNAGKGLFATHSIPPNATLFIIPATAMMNSRTLSATYPPLQGQYLSPTQVISLHLLLHKPHDGGESHDSRFGSYISTLPRDFDSHPLTWSVNKHLQTNSNPKAQELLGHLPPSVSSSLQALTARFWEDWDAVRKYVTALPMICDSSSRQDIDVDRFRLGDSALTTDYVWAWLNVNTRCIYYRLDPSVSSPLNMTLCPILDFANHAPTATHIKPVLPLDSELWAAPTGPRKHTKRLGGDYAFTSNCETTIPPDTELFLRYGSHPNRKLFVEYGFTNTWHEGDLQRGRCDGEVDVQDIVEEHFKAKGPIADTMRRILDEEGYWGDWTMHASPPAHPSYRLITALRLLHCKDDDVQHDRVGHWKAVVLGEQAIISQEHEQAWRNTLLKICETLIERANSNIVGLNERTLRPEHGLPDWYEWMLGNVRRLWLEELEVASCVAQSVQSGVEF